MQRAMMKGFIVSDHPEKFEEAANYLAGLLAEGKLKYDETIVDGFDNAPEHLRKLFTGENKGKLLIKVAEPSA
jgi:NADPH:quinone reductase